MKNKEKEFHHFVPQAYLRKFAHTIEQKGLKKNYFVTAYDKIENKRIDKIEVGDLCAKKKLYTLESDERAERESVENLYAETFDKEFKKVYELITDKNKIKINLQERELIISWIVSMHLRNYLWLKAFNDFSSKHIESIIERYGEGFNEKVYWENGEVLYDFENKSKDEIIKIKKQKNKQSYIHLHLREIITWTKFHFHDLIIVESSSLNENFITSDRPVICENGLGSLRIAIDSNHLVTLQPKIKVEAVGESSIERTTCTMDPNFLNSLQYDNSSRHIIAQDSNSLILAKEKYTEVKSAFDSGEDRNDVVLKYVRI